MLKHDTSTRHEHTNIETMCETKYWNNTPNTIFRYDNIPYRNTIWKQYIDTLYATDTLKHYGNNMPKQYIKQYTNTTGYQ